MSKQIGKLYIISMINKKKDILFGKLTDKLTLQMKINEWKKIEVSAKEHDLIGSQKDWKYVRDVLWQNLKRTTLFKCHNAKKSGTQCKLTDADKIVLEIIGRESPILKEIKESESRSAKVSIKIDAEPLINNSSFSENLVIDDNYSSNNNSSSSDSLSNLRGKRNADMIENKKQNEEFIELKKKRLNLQIYNLKLDALQKERQLNLSASKFTKDIKQKDENCYMEIYRN